MKKFIVVGLILAVAGVAEAKKLTEDQKTCAAIVGPVLEGAKIGKFRRGKRLDVFVEYLDTYGFTEVDDKGIHWHVGNHVINGNLFYPPEYYADDYPLYLIGKTMNVNIHVRNTGKRRIKHLRVVAMHEYLNIFGADGENLPGNSTKAFFIENLGKKKSRVLNMKYYIPGGTAPGLDQTHVVITKCRGVAKGNCCSKQRLFVNLPQAGLFCPPE